LAVGVSLLLPCGELRERFFVLSWIESRLILIISFTAKSVVKELKVAVFRFYCESGLLMCCFSYFNMRKRRLNLGFARKHCFCGLVKWL